MEDWTFFYYYWQVVWPNNLKIGKINGYTHSCSQKSNLNRHVESVHEGNKPFKCDFCVYSCTQRNKLNIHVDSVHDGKKPFKCVICDYRSSTKQTIKRHVLSVGWIDVY